MIEQSWASKAKHNVQSIHSVLHEAAGFLSRGEEAENQRPCPMNSFAESCSSCIKRKAEHDHPDAPPEFRRQDRTNNKDLEKLTEAERFLLSDDDMAAGGSHNMQQAAVYAGIFNVDGSLVHAEQQGLTLTEAAEGGTRLGTKEEEEVTETLQAAECWNHGGLPDLSPSMGDMPCRPAPGFSSYESGLHVAKEWQSAEWWNPGGLLNSNMSMGEDISSLALAPAIPLCMSGLHPAAADCQNPCCGLESVAFDAWASIESIMRRCLIVRSTRLMFCLQ